MGLVEYRAKRDFRKSPEPRGGRRSSPGPLAYLIQKHDASHLHYDFRLELDGVLKSWAVPKGPDLDPAVKRLALQVEDHPLEYGDFEGTIPPGQYGGGTVMLWDRGTWEPLGDARRGLSEGKLKFIIHGEKLQGAWMLVRRGGHKPAGQERQWFLFKERDEFADAGQDITVAQPRSVSSGRDLDEIAARAGRVWGPSGEVRQKGQSAVPAERKKLKSRGRSSPGQLVKQLLAAGAAAKSKLPKTPAAELATLVKTAPAGPEWLHEIKFDGYRMLCRIDRGRAHFISRNGHDWTKKFPELAQAAGGLAVRRALLDGEVVAVEPDGVTRFQALQKVFQTGRTQELVYYVFDLLHLDGVDLTGAGLEDRKAILQTLVDREATGPLRLSEYLEGAGPDVFAQACRLHLEGIISKRRGSPYRPGRGLDWLKTKCAVRRVCYWRFYAARRPAPASGSNSGGLLRPARQA